MFPPPRDVCQIVIRPGQLDDHGPVRKRPGAPWRRGQPPATGVRPQRIALGPAGRAPQRRQHGIDVAGFGLAKRQSRGARVQKTRRYAPTPELLVSEHAGQKRAIGGDAHDLDVRERLVQPISRLAARLAPRDHLAQHGIVKCRDLIAGVDANVQPETGSGIGPVQVRDAAHARQIPVLRIFGVQTRLHGGAMLEDIVLRLG